MLAGGLGGTIGRRRGHTQDHGGPVLVHGRYYPDRDRDPTGEFRFKSDRLHNPERLFFDLIGAKPQIPARDNRGVSSIAVGDRFIRKIRIAETQRAVTRIVLDLESNAEFSTSQLANPDRLIIEVHSTLSDRRFLATPPRQPDPPSYAPAYPPVYPPVQARVSRVTLESLQFRRRAAVQAMMPSLPPPPSPVDESKRFATWAYSGPDPWGQFPGSKVPALPRPPRNVRPSAPKVVARNTPPPSSTTAPAAVEPTYVPPVKTPSLPPQANSPEPEEIGLPAKSTAQGDTLTRVLGLKLGRVVIDPGHGGNDAGTTGPNGLREKDVALDVAKRLGALIQERLGSEVVYTRTDDTFIPLSRRTAIANQRKADLFLSIHVNSSPYTGVSGVETYYLSLNGTRDALETAMRENAGSDKNIGDLQDLLKKIALKDKVDESREFALRVQSSLLTMSPRAARSSKDRGVKRAPFVVLIGASMPAVLAEVGFITNAQDETQMKRSEHRQKIAEALFKGVSAYSNSLSHFQVAHQANRVAAKPSGIEGQ